MLLPHEFAIISREDAQALLHLMQRLSERCEDYHQQVYLTRAGDVLDKLEQLTKGEDNNE